MLYSHEDIHLASSFAQQGIELDPTNADCHSNLGLARLWAEGVDAATPAFRRALEMNAGDSYVLADASVHAVYDGLLDKSRELLTRAFQLNPVAPQWFSEYRGLLSFVEGRYAEAIHDFTGVVERMYNLTYQISCLGHLGEAGALRTILPRVRSKGWNLQSVVDGEPFRESALRDRLSEGITKACTLSKD